jgi:peptide-methionine (R)-S-oxide reductase
MMNRRHLIMGGAAAIGAGLAARAMFGGGAAARERRFEVSLSEAAWRKRLTPQQFYVLRESGTERPFTHKLNGEKRKGRFDCAGCALPLFMSATKYDSGTGWPSFYAPIKGAVGTSTDYLLGYPRTEVHCRRCGGHLGHVFDDGPRPTGKRYCINGAAMTFAPA